MRSLCAVLTGLLFIALPGAAGAAYSKVVVITPPHAHIKARAASAAKSELPPPVVISVVVYVLPSSNYRAIHVNRALFQTWTGFYKQYSGPRYPF